MLTLLALLALLAGAAIGFGACYVYVAIVLHRVFGRGL